MLSSRREFLKQCGSAVAGLYAGAAHLSYQGKGSKKEQELRARLAADPLRPQFHLLPAKNWMNDPNGPIYWKGRYHMFFQYNPHAAVWGDMHWAHAVSADMIHWRHMPIALAPTPGWDDADGCFTGSAVDDGGTATVVYTGVKSVPAEQATLRDGSHNFRETQCLATSADPELRTWKKWGRPILQPPDDPELTGFRDPFLWRDGEVWYLGVGSGRRKQGGSVLLYRSRDLREWEYLHPLATGLWTERESVNPVESGEMWECPDFFPLGSKHVLLYSTAGQVIWKIGQLDRKEMVFHPEKRGVLDHGAYYAQKTQVDRQGNRILWGWIPEKRAEAEYSAAGWAGCMALPRVLSLDANGELEMRVAAEARSLRAKEFVVPEKAEMSARSAAFREIKIEELCGELAWKVRRGGAELQLADGSGPWWSMSLEEGGSAAKLTVNGVSVDLAAASGREFHLFVDASVAELICDNTHALTTRIYRKPDRPLGVVIKGSDLGGVESFQAWQLKPISRDRLTT
jgi:beta-fructofuranosidase